MTAIQVHHTDTVDISWDGPGNVARLKNDAGRSVYRRMFAWFDPDGDQDTKSAYKFPHHEVGEDGEPGAANVRACIAIIAALNGARGGAEIPEHDREGVWRHVAAHLRDADMEPPELKRLDSSIMGEMEVRTWMMGLEVRELDDGGREIVGHAAVFNRLSEPIFGMFREEIAPGAFRDVLGDDVRALWNHDPNFVLGRTTAGTLRIWEDDVGLGVVIRPPDTQWARDFTESIRRGDVTQMSFGFMVDEGDEAFPAGHGPDGLPIRRILRVSALYDVSPVTFPAYPQTSVALRHKLERLRARPREPRARLEIFKRHISILEKEF